MQGLEAAEGQAANGATGSNAAKTHPEVAKNGRRPRWDEKEDAFLIAQLRKGMKPKDVVAAYKASNFGKQGRPDNGVLARIDQVKNLAKKPAVVEPEVPKAPTKVSTYNATGQICDMLVGFDTQDRRRIMRAVADLMDTDEPSTH